MTSIQIALLVSILLGSGMSADKVAKVNSVLENANTPTQTIPKATPLPIKPAVVSQKPVAIKESPENPRCSIYADYKEVDGYKKVEVRWNVYDAVGAEIRYFSGNWANNGMYFAPVWITDKISTSNLPSGSRVFPTEDRYQGGKLTYIMHTYDKNHGYNASCRVDLDAQTSE